MGTDRRQEPPNHHAYRCLEDVPRSLFHYIEIFFNRRRRHQALGYLTPEAFEVKNARSKTA